MFNSDMSGEAPDKAKLPNRVKRIKSNFDVQPSQTVIAGQFHPRSLSLVVPFRVGSNTSCSNVKK